jgi:hypothetical protein
MTNMATRKPRTAPSVSSSHPYVLNKMTEISATELSDAELSEYKDIGFVVLKKRVDPVLVRAARIAVAKKVQDACKTWRNDTIFETVYENTNWPSECETLYRAVEVSI